MDLYNAVVNGEIDKVKCLIEGGKYDINIQHMSSGNTPLHIAVSWAQDLTTVGADDDSVTNTYMDIVWLLLVNGANPEITNRNGHNVLYKAASRGNVGPVSCLIASGTDLAAEIHSKRYAFSKSPLHVACYIPPRRPLSKSSHVVNKVLTYTYCCYKVAKHWMETFLETSEHEEYLDYIRNDYDKLTSFSASPTEYIPDEIYNIIIYYNYFCVVVDLVKSGADINAKDLGGESPLHPASFCGHLAIVKFLVDKGADVSSKNNLGQSPKDLAVQNDQRDVIEFFDTI